MRILVVSFLLLLLSGCATEFRGSAHIDKKACYEKCSEWNMKVAGLVAMGEYSTACVCAPKGATKDEISQLLDNTNGYAGAVAGVAMQTKKRQQQQQNMSGFH